MSNVTAKFSDSYEAKRKRIQRLPKLIERTMWAYAKKNAALIIKSFQDGIRNNSFRLTPLAESTIKQKQRKGYRKPTTPLYGVGDGSDRTLINALRLRRLSKGWDVRLSQKKHHGADMTVGQLLLIHENGAIIRKRTGIIVIPPRPARILAYERAMKKIRSEEQSKEVRAAMAEYIRYGRDRRTAIQEKIAERVANGKGN